MSVLDPSEEEIFNKPAYYEKKKVNLILSNVRVVIADKKTIIQDINYHLIDKIKHTKKDYEKADEKTTVKLRIIDVQDNKFDISFKGVNSLEDLKVAVKIIKQKQKDIENENYGGHDSGSSEHRGSSSTKFEGYLYEKGEPPGENKLKAIMLTQNPSVSDTFKHLGDKKILNPEAFWVNFKTQLADVLSLEDYQQEGYSGRFLSEVDADISKSRGNQFSFTLNDNIRRQILRKKPRVAERFISFLREKEKPSKKEEPMTKEEAEIVFWQQYFAAGLRDTSLIKSKKDKDKSNIFDTVSTKDTVCFNENSRAKRAKNLGLSVRVGSLYEPINPIGNASYLNGCGQGIFNKELLPQLLQGTIDAFNIHSELSLIDNKIIPDTTREIPDVDENTGEHIEVIESPLYTEPQLDDLLPKEEITVDTLNIVENIAKHPFEEVDPQEFKNEAEKFADNLFAFNQSFKRLIPPVQPQKKEAEIILRDMTGDLSHFYNYNKNSQYFNLDEVLQLKIENQILLFLFWSNYLSPKIDKEKNEMILNEILQKEEFIAQRIKDYSNSQNSGFSKSEESSRALIPLYEEMEDSLKRVLNLSDSQSTGQQSSTLPTNFNDYFF